MSTGFDLLQSVINTLDEGVCLLDREGRVRAANTAALRLLDFHPIELVGRPAFEDFAAGNLATPSSFFTEGIFRRRDSTAFAVSYRLDPLPHIFEDERTVMRFRAIDTPAACDLALRDSEAKLRVTLDTITDGVIAIDESGIIQVFNPASERMFGYRSEEAVGRNVNLLMPSPDHEAHDGYIASYLRTGVRKIIGIGREVTGKRKDGGLFPLHLSIGEAIIGRGRLFVGMLHDLTERKRAEEKLMILSSAVEQSPNAVLIADADGKIEYVNSGFTRLTGYGPEAVHGKPPSLLRSEGTPAEIHDQIWQALHAGGVWQGEIRDRKKDGELYWALETISPIRNARGAVTHFLAIQQDITELKRDKEALQESEERFRQVAEMTGEWLWEQDPQGRYIYSSGAVRDILGYEPEEILGKNYLDLLTPQDEAHWRSELAPLPNIHRRFNRLVNRYRHRGGAEVFTESTGEPIFDAFGRLLKWRGVDHNITGRKRYEDALRLRDRAIEAASVGINITDARDTDCPNIYVNPALTRITGYAREELLGKDMRMLQGPDTDAAHVQQISEALRGGRGCEVVLRNYRKDGTPFWNSLLIAPVRDEAGDLTHYIGVQTDVTELRRATEERNELEIARQIQLSLLPKEPLQRDEVQIAGICLPASHVGGDYFDYFRAGANLDIVIADVSGHSVGAALIMAETRSALRAAVRQMSTDPNGPRPGEMLCALNELLHEDLSRLDLFISMFYASIDLARRQLHYANAGHNRTLLLRRGEATCRQLDADGIIFGVRNSVSFEEKTEPLSSGDRLLFYTDGMTEAQDGDGNFFGVSRLCALFSSLQHHSPELAIAELVREVRGFCGGRPFNDDVSLVVLQVEERAAECPTTATTPATW